MTPAFEILATNQVPELPRIHSIQPRDSQTLALGLDGLLTTPIAGFYRLMAESRHNLTLFFEICYGYHIFSVALIDAIATGLRGQGGAGFFVEPQDLPRWLHFCRRHSRYPLVENRLIAEGETLVTLQTHDAIKKKGGEYAVDFQWYVIASPETWLTFLQPQKTTSRGQFLKLLIDKKLPVTLLFPTLALEGEEMERAVSVIATARQLKSSGETSRPPRFSRARLFFRPKPIHYRNIRFQPPACFGKIDRAIGDIIKSCDPGDTIRENQIADLIFSAYLSPTATATQIVATLEREKPDPLHKMLLHKLLTPLREMTTPPIVAMARSLLQLDRQSIMFVHHPRILEALRENPLGGMMVLDPKIDAETLSTLGDQARKGEFRLLVAPDTLVPKLPPLEVENFFHADIPLDIRVYLQRLLLIYLNESIPRATLCFFQGGDFLFDRVTARVTHPFSSLGALTLPEVEKFLTANRRDNFTSDILMDIRSGLDQKGTPDFNLFNTHLQVVMDKLAGRER